MKLNKKGFTLAELLIVIAIIGVLIAIAIPVFTNSLEKANLAVDEANIRAGYAEYVAANLLDGSTDAVAIPATKTEGSAQIAGLNVTWGEGKTKVTVSISGGKATAINVE